MVVHFPARDIWRHLDNHYTRYFTKQFLEKREQTRKFVAPLPLKGKKENTKLDKTSNI